MKIEYVDPFLRAGYSVLETLLKSRPGRGPLSMREITFTSQQVTITIGVTGGVEGTVLYGMSLVTAQKIASEMLGEPVQEMNDMVWSAISELGNIITGNAAGFLHEAGVTCDTTPPAVIKGVNVEISTVVPALIVPMTTKFGRLEINVALREALTQAKAA